MLSRRQALIGFGAGLSLAACARGQTSSTPAVADSAGANWRSAPNLPVRVQEIYPTLLDDIFYVAGGLSPDAGEGRIGITDRVFALEPGANRWRERARMPIPVHHPNCMSYGGLIYAMGGFTASSGGAWTMSQTVRIYDPQLNAWRGGPDMPTPYGETVTAELSGRLHVVTGRRPAGLSNRNWSDHADTNAHIVLDPASQTWSTAAPAPTARNSAAGAVLDGKLYVTGGRTVSGGNSDAHERYDPQTDRWDSLSPLPQSENGPRGCGGLAMAALDGALFAFGGEWFDSAGGGVYSEVWRYLPETDSWAAVGHMPTPRHGLGALTFHDSIWTFAGAARAGGNDTTALVEVFTP